MYDVSIWVPTRGWRKLKEFSDLKDACEYALRFVPLEVQVAGPHTRIVSGTMHEACSNTPMMTMIEETIENLFATRAD